MAYFSTNKSHMVVAILSNISAPKGVASGPTRGAKIRSTEEAFVIDPDELLTFSPLEVDDFFIKDR